MPGRGTDRDRYPDIYGPDSGNLRSKWGASGSETSGPPAGEPPHDPARGPGFREALAAISTPWA